MTTATRTTSSSTNLFVPDLCRVRVVLLLVISTQLAVSLFAMVRATSGLVDWDWMGLVSLFAQWIVLVSAALICLLRRFLPGFSVPVITLMIVLLVQLVVAGFTLGAQWFLQGGQPFSPGWDALSRNLAVAAMITLIVLRYFYLQYRWRLEKQAQMDARLAALQARIQPHFLFNSMNTIASLIATHPDQAEDAVLDLSELFRASLRGGEQGLIPLSEELTMCRRYLGLEGLRLGDRLQVDWQVDDQTLDQPLPPLCVQPLLENAIYHGIQPLPDGGTVTIEAHATPHWTQITVRNPLPEPDSEQHQGHQMALDNVRARLATAFDPSGELQTRRDGRIFEVTLNLPRASEAQRHA